MAVEVAEQAEAAPPARPHPMRALARWLGCTEGQAYTLVIALAVGLVFAVIGIPPTLEDRPEVSSAPSAPGLVGSLPSTAPGPSTAVLENTSAAAAPAAFSDADLAAVPDAAVPDPNAAVAAPAAPPSVATVFARVEAPGAPEGIVVSGGGEVYVATNNAGSRGVSGASKILKYTAGGALERSFDVAGQPADKKDGLTGLAVLSPTAVLALDGSTGRVLQLDITTGAVSTLATLIDLPACGAVVAAPACEPGAEDHTPLPRAAAVDAEGNVYVTDAGQATVWRVVAAVGQAEPWHSSVDYTGTSAPAGILIDKDGSIVFAAGDIYRVPVGTAARPGTRARIADLADADRPGGIVLTPAGDFAVALSGVNQIAVVAPDGAPKARVTTGEGDQIPFDEPVGVVARGLTLLVTNQSTAANDASHWAVLEVSLAVKRSGFLLVLGLAVGMLIAGVLVPLAIGDRIDDTARNTLTAGPSLTTPTLEGPATEVTVGPGAAAAPGAPSITGTAAPRQAAGTAAAATPGAPTARRTASDIGVTAESIKVGIFLLSVESLQRAGVTVLGVDPEQQKEAWNVYIDDLNAKGGALGRKIEPYFRAYDVLLPDSQRAACLDMADHKPFATIDLGGIDTANLLCVVDEHKLPHVTFGSLGIPQQTFAKAQGRLFSMFPGGVRSIANLVWELHIAGKLKGQKIGLVADERLDPGGSTIESGAIDTLRQLGYQVTHRSRLSADTGTAASQIPIEVNAMQTSGVTLILMLTGSINAQAFVQNADGRRYDPTYSATDWASLYSDTCCANMPQSFDGTELIGTTRNGDFRVNRPEVDYDGGCRVQFEKKTGKKLDRSGLPYNTTVRICSLFDIFLRGVNGAGVELTRARWSQGIQAVGALPLGTFGGGSFKPGKFDAADLLRTQRWVWEYPAGTSCKCWIPVTDFRPAHFA